MQPYYWYNNKTFTICIQTSSWNNKLNPKLNTIIIVTYFLNVGLLCWENPIHFHKASLVNKNGFAPLPINKLVAQRNVWARLTRSRLRENISVPRKKPSSGQTAFTVRASQFWYAVPLNIQHSDCYTINPLRWGNTWVQDFQTETFTLKDRFH